ncbi:MAG TPA: FlgD immunoglobulin-like domain containing protein, partial [Candidatus Saccharimonadales bacterium]|nr:FlgD immunoglobulin-like domain containing protein [Candidatus Saccharimonadales bacterium]
HAGSTALVIASLMLLVAPLRAAGAADPCPQAGPPPGYTLGGLSIEGIHSAGMPAEPCIAVGPQHILCIGPGDVRVFDKATGQLLRDQCQNVFFQTSTGCLSGANPVYGDGGGMIDPDCYYDRVAQRFLAVSLSYTGTGGFHVKSHLHLAVSQTSNPLDPWWVYHLSTGVTALAPGYTFIPDRPSLGVSRDKIGLASHMFSLDGGTDFTLFRVVDRDSAYAGLVPNALRPDSLNYYDRADYDTLALDYRLGKNANADATLHALSIGGRRRNSALYRSFTGPAAACAMSDTVGLGLRYASTYTYGRRAPQPASTVRVIDALDPGPNPSSLWVRGGVLSVAWNQPTLFCGTDTGSALHVLRLKVAPSGGGPTLSAMLDTLYGGPGAWYAFPSVCDDSLGRVYLGFMASSPTVYPSCYVTGMQPAEPAIEVYPTLVKAGETAWTRVDGGGNVGRWGDFSNIDLDESVSPPMAYFVGQWAKRGTTSSVDTLGTWIQDFFFAGPTAVEGGPAPKPAARNVVIEGSWPNPARGEVRLRLSLREPARVRMEVTDVAGRRIRVLADEPMSAGSHELVWDGRDESGAAAGVGVYLCWARDAGSSSLRKVVVLR